MRDLFLYPTMSALMANFLAQFLKVLFYRVKFGRWDWHWVIWSGGFPSSHSSTVTALALSIGIQEGFSSDLFAVVVVMASIVCYDACHVRWYCGKNIEITQALISDLKNSGVVELNDPKYTQKMKTVLGHRISEVFGGIVVGLIVPVVFYLMGNL